MTGVVRELPAEPASRLIPREGHHATWRDCRACGEEFCVYVPVEAGALGNLTHPVRCPHCHRASVEVLVERSEKPILVVPVARSAAGRRWRRVRRFLDARKRHALARVKGWGWSIRKRLARPARRSA